MTVAEQIRREIQAINDKMPNCRESDYVELDKLLRIQKGLREYKPNTKGD